MIKTVCFNKRENCLELIDQTALPVRETIVKCYSETDVAEAIKTMVVRGSTAIGITAGYGIYLGLQKATEQNFKSTLNDVCDLIAGVRPTSVNLFCTIHRVKEAVSSCTTAKEAVETALSEADKIFEEDLAMCRAIGGFGQEVMEDGTAWLTHCNAGALATSGYGTALGIFRTAKEAGKNVKIFVNETRPLLQGARLTAWELQKEGFDVTVIADNTAGSLIREGKINGVVVGADCVTSKGFVVNKVGTYPLAVLCKYNGIPFYVAVPATAFDMSLKYDDEIVIEQSDSKEMGFFNGVQVIPEGVNVYNPAFDITPPELITGIITDKGIIEPIYGENIPVVLGLEKED